MTVSVFPPAHNTQLPNLFNPCGFVQKSDTYLYSDSHSTFVWTIIQLDRQHSEFDSITWSVVWPVRLNEGGNILKGEVDGGGVCEKEIVSSVAPHSQVEECILGSKSKNLEWLHKQFQ